MKNEVNKRQRVMARDLEQTESLEEGATVNSTARSMLRKKTSFSAYPSEQKHPSRSTSPTAILASQSPRSQSPLPSRNVRSSHESPRFVQRALTTIQHAFHPGIRPGSRGSQTSDASSNSNNNNSYSNMLFGANNQSQSDLSGKHGSHSNYHATNHYTTHNGTTNSISNSSHQNSELSNYRPQYTQSRHPSSDSTKNKFTYSTYSSNSNGTNDSFYSSGTVISPLTTDDDDSSSNSHRQNRPRALSKTGSLPASPLSNISRNSSGTHALSTLSLQGPENKFSTARMAEMDKPNISTPQPVPELRVRHYQRGAKYAGYLTKFSSRTFFSRKQWKRRYFILHQKSLHCFKSSDPQHPLLESITLCADTIVCVTDIFSGKRYCLQITCPGQKNWYVLADSASEMSGWLKELKGTVLQFRSLHLTSRPGTYYSDSSEMSDLSVSSALTMDINAPSVPTVPSQYDYQLFNTYVGGGISSIATFTPPPRPIHPSVLASSQAMLYQGPHASLNPPPRTVTPKPTPSTTPTPSEEPRKRKNSSVTNGQSPAEYVSFGTVMERAEAMSPVDDEKLPFPFEEAAAVVPRQRKGSSSSSVTASNHRVSIVIERPETLVSLPRRSSQRLMGSPSRPMSPVSSRPMSPNRSSPRSSLVVSPPPRSVHRPTSMAIRHSTQMASPLEMAALGLAASAGTMSSEGSLARITSIRHTRDISTLTRKNGATSPTGSLRERISSSRSSILVTNLSSTLPPPPHSAPATLTTVDRPTSPLPDLTTAPTQPLPEPPKSPVIGPGARAVLSHSLSNSSTRRISIIPRHHDPEVMMACSRTKAIARSRTQSQDSALIAIARNGEKTPSPRLGAVFTQGDGTHDPAIMRAERASLIRSLASSPIQKNFVLPAPPTCSQPELPISHGGYTYNHSRQASSSSHRHTLSTSSLCIQLGNPPKKVSSRDLNLSVRLSTLSTLPPGSSTAPVPLPPQTALPPIPCSPAPSPELAAQELMTENELGTNQEQDVSEEEKMQIGGDKNMCMHTSKTVDGEVANLDKGFASDSCCESKFAQDSAAPTGGDHAALASGFEMILEEEEEIEQGRKEQQQQQQPALVHGQAQVEEQDAEMEATLEATASECTIKSGPAIEDAAERTSLTESEDSRTAVDAAETVKELSIKDFSENENEIENVTENENEMENRNRNEAKLGEHLPSTAMAVLAEQLQEVVV
ncbi:hypothetical protein BG004_002284 [Podila humilis]|nr:hypothetical protein BG004_002284 [Podila humilis]